MASMETILNVLSQSEELPVSVRQMMVDCLPAAMNGEDRFLKVALPCALGEVTQSLAKQQATLTQAREEAVTALSCAEQAVSSTRQDAAAKSAVAAKHAEDARKAKVEAGVIGSEMRKVIDTHRKVAARCAQAQRELDEATAIRDGPLQILLGGGWSDDDTKDVSIDAVMQHLTAMGVEPALRAAAPAALGSPNSCRSEYCKLVLEYVQKVVETSISEKRSLVNAAVEKEARAEMLGYTALHEVRTEQAERKKQEASEARQAAELAYGLAQQASEEAIRKRTEVTQQEQAILQLQRRSDEVAQALKMLEATAATTAAEGGQGAVVSGEVCSSSLVDAQMTPAVPEAQEVTVAADAAGKDVEMPPSVADAQPAIAGA